MDVSFKKSGNKKSRFLLSMGTGIYHDTDRIVTASHRFPKLRSKEEVLTLSEVKRNVISYHHMS